ncbi:MAG TPA: DUF58 domain-containing protein [Chloroflexi bacterium]|nr:DUF58 domain-containing protein [Chloroflexota bacterium]
MLLNTDLLPRLESLSLVVRRVRAGQTVGERRSTRRGSSVEFADYRDYTQGDDLRRVDWNIYARLERPYVKLFEEEEDLAVHLLLDGSASMDWGGSSEQEDGAEQNKWRYARQLAAAIGYVALLSGDRLTISTLRSSSIQARFGPVRGQGHTLRMFEWLEMQAAHGATDLNAALRTYAITGGRAGLVMVLSDLFSPSGYADGLTALAAHGHEVVVMHLLSPDEISPPLGGDLRLLDVETGDSQEVTIDGGMRTLYHRRVEAWREEIRRLCRSRDMHYLPLVTDCPFDRVVLYDLRRAGVVR